MAAKIIEKTDGAFAETIASGIWLVDFWAEWCGPCKMMGRVLEEQIAPRADEAVNILKVNVDSNPDLAVQFEVMSIPALMVFKDGALVKRMDGLQPADTVLAALDAAK